MGTPLDLLEAAREARDRAYAPYSGFPVGAALRSRSGRIHAAANVENASFPQSQCAEASAIGVMVAAGDRELAEVLVIGSSTGPCPPCGGCRQRLAEFASADVLVHMLGRDGTVLTRFLGELLPESFSLQADARQQPLDPVAFVRERVPGFVPAVGMILGSGLGTVADAISPVAVIDYGDLSGFPRPTVEGHAGSLVLGYFGGVRVACLRGRIHLYEGRPASAVRPLIHTLRGLGCEVILLTNAAGSIQPELQPGSIAMIADHINLMGSNPLVGPNDDAIGPRFPDLSAVYDPDLMQTLELAAAEIEVPIRRGVYLAVLGPSFETPAEIRAFRVLGADLVGMSTVPEAILARHCGMRVVGLSIVTNLAAGLGSGELSHAETLATSQAAAGRLAQLLAHAMPELARAAATDA